MIHTESIAQRKIMYGISAVMILVILAGSGSFAFAADQSIPPGFQLVAENDILELYFEPENAYFIVHDLRSGMQWHTNPPGDLSHIASGLWQSHAKSQLFFKITDEKRRQSRETDPLVQGARLAYEPIKDGVRIIYSMQAAGLQIITDYTLGTDYLEVRIPWDGIMETRESLLVEIDLLPFFGAATDDDEGYLVFPDSSGAIAPFTARHGRYSRQFEEYVYGPESYPFSEYSPMQSVHRQVPMPIFGSSFTDKGAILGVVTEGEFDTKIVAAPSGYIVDYYRTNPKFVIRREYLAPIRQGVNVPTIENRAIATDRAVRYYILPPEQSDYSGMALKYREHLVEEMGLQPGRITNDEGVAPMHLRIFMSVQEDSILFKNLITLTTFAEAREIVQTLLDLGISELDVSISGWNQGGYAGRFPRRLPVESAIGGEAGMREFIDWAHQYNIKVYLLDNYIDAYADNRGFSRRTEVVRSPARLPITGWTPGFRSDRYLVSPLVAYEKFAAPDIPRMAQFGADGLEFERFGWTLISDRNANFVAEREDVARVWTDIIELANNQMGGSIVQGGNAYLLPYVDKVVRAPMEETTHLFASRSIPFYQIAVHGVVPYYGWPGNLRSEPVRSYLKSVEYGSLPIFELTYHDSSLLKEAQRYNILFSSKYDLWIDVALDEYQSQSVEMGYLQDIAIIRHTQLDTFIFETVYEDGTRVIVNHHLEDDWTDGTLVVPAADFIWISGGVQQ